MLKEKKSKLLKAIDDDDDDDDEFPVPLHIVHHQGDNDMLREISITGSTFSIGMRSCFPNEDMNFLIDKTLSLYKSLKGID